MGLLDKVKIRRLRRLRLRSEEREVFVMETSKKSP